MVDKVTHSPQSSPQCFSVPENRDLEDAFAQRKCDLGLPEPASVIIGLCEVKKMPGISLSAGSLGRTPSTQICFE